MILLYQLIMFVTCNTFTY